MRKRSVSKEGNDGNAGRSDDFIKPLYEGSESLVFKKQFALQTSKEPHHVLNSLTQGVIVSKIVYENINNRKAISPLFSGFRSGRLWVSKLLIL